MKETTNDITYIKHLLGLVNDPELPVLSIVDLGILRDVKSVDGMYEIIITPTYSGCPAMDVIGMDIRAILIENGITNFSIKTVLSPAWTTEWMSGEGKVKLKAYGVAPPLPMQSVCTPGLFQKEEAVGCPRCDSLRTSVVSQFGSTACKAMYKCEECLETFEYFKCH